MTADSDHGGGSPQLEARRRWLRHRKERDTDSEVDVTVGIAASFTADPIEALLGAALLDAGFEDPDFRLADYNQLHQVCLDPSSTLGADLDYLVLLWRLEDVFERQFSDYVAGNDAAGSEILNGVAELASLVKQLETATSATVVVSTPPHPAGWSVDLLDPTASGRIGRLHREAMTIWLDAVSASSSLEFVDLDALQRHAGESAVFDAQKWALYRQPYGNGFYSVVAAQLAEALSRRILVAPKCVVLDCDNTLWGGIVGEDGIGGLELGDNFPGRAFREFQRSLKVLKSRGVMLAVASKNDETDVLDVFERHEGMVLGPDDIAAWRIDWEPKPGNLESIAAELNIAIESLVFVDDNPVEIEEVANALPGVRCLRVPDELAALPTLLADSGLFRGGRISVEDRNRTGMIRSESLRRSQGETMSRDEFLASLELRVTFAEVGAEHIARVAQLTQKTNQFNLTTIRRDEAQIRRLLSSPTSGVYAMHVADRFGEYGLVGVAIVEGDADAWEIDTLLMSCRVLGRGVESAFLHALANAATTRGVKRLTGRYEPSRKNAQVADLYPSHGFAPVEGSPGTFTLNLEENRPPKPDHITLVS